MKAFIILLVCAFAAAEDQFQNQWECVNQKLSTIFETSLNDTIRECLANNPKYANIVQLAEDFHSKACDLRKTLEACENNWECLLQNVGPVVKLRMELVELRFLIWQQAANMDDDTKKCIHNKIEEMGDKLAALRDCWYSNEPTETTTVAQG